MAKIGKVDAQRLRDAIDDYLDTVRALYSFAASVSWEHSAKALRSEARHAVPRRMNQASAGKRVTPDAVIQAMETYGVVAEAKKNFVSKDARVFEQLKEYDDDLIGWWTENEAIETYDLALLVHQFSSVAAADALKKWQDEGGKFKRNAAVIEFGLVHTGQPWFHLKRVAGQLSDLEHDEALRRGKQLGKVVLGPIIAKYKFTEAEPPLIHTMHLLHDYIFPLYPKVEEFESGTGSKKLIATVTVDNLRDKMEQQFCDSQDGDARRFRLPKRAWVASAMEEFRRIGLAAKVKEKPATYQVRLRRPTKKDTIEYLAELLSKADAATMRLDPGQGELFEADRK